MPSDRTWYRIHVQTDEPEVADITIYDFIGDWIDGYWGFGKTAQQFLDELSRIPETVKTIRVRVNSPGGDAFAAQAIASVLRDRRAQQGTQIEVMIEGLAASAATIVSSVGKPVRIGDNALMMVHNPWTFAIGESKDLRKAADTLDAVRSSIITAYKWRSPLSEDELGELMDEATWMNADEALLYGFADEKIAGLQAVASLFDPRGFERLPIPETYRDRIAAMIRPKTQEGEEDWRVGGARDLSLNEDRSWDGDAADRRVRQWASRDGSGDEEQMDWPKYRKAFIVYDSENAENFEGYKLGFADVVDGELVAIKAGLQACRVVLNGGRGGVDLPDDVIEDAKKFVDGYLGAQDEEETEDAAAVIDAVAHADLDPAVARELVAARATRGQVRARIAAEVEAKQRAEARAKEIRGLCQTAKLPELAESLIRGGAPLEEVKQQLTIITARMDKAEIDTSLRPDAGSRARARLNPADIYAERNRLGALKEG